MRNPIAGKVILITGASSGIGAGTARRLAREGARLALAARRAGLLETLAADITAAGGQAIAIPCDLTALGAPRHVVQRTLEHYGRLDVLINNAGLGIGSLVQDLQPEALRDQVDLNLVAVIECAQAALQPMLAQRSGHIINVASLAGLVGLPGHSVYSATKFAVIGFSDALRREVRRQGVHVTAFCPGFVATPFSPDLQKISERAPDAPVYPFVMSVEYVAGVIAGIICRPRGTVLVPFPFTLLIRLAALLPALADRVLERVIQPPDRP
jgi:uncharacterized protein